MMKHNFGMIQYGVILLSMFNVFDAVGAQNCSVTVSGPKPNTPCAFPFIFAGKIHWSCTDMKDPGNHWCSTKVDKDGKHIGGASYWGYCPKSCSEEDQTSVRSNSNRPGNIWISFKSYVSYRFYGSLSGWLVKGL